MKRLSLLLMLALVASSCVRRPPAPPRLRVLTAPLLVEEIAGNHAALPELAGPPPEQGAQWIDARTGLAVRRLSSVTDIPQGTQAAAPYDGFPGRGLTNGYSRFSCVNKPGTLCLAYGTQPGVNALYELPSGKYLGQVKFKLGTGALQALGETHNPRWSGRPGEENTLYFKGIAESRYQHKMTIDPVLAASAAASGLQQMVYDFDPIGLQLKQDHCDQSSDGRYRGYHTSAHGGVIDLLEQRLLPGRTAPGEVDISPTGDWAMVDLGTALAAASGTASRFYRVKDLDTATTPAWVNAPTKSHGHDGWAFDRQGREVWVFQDNQTDWFSAFNPATLERTDIFNMKSWGWDLNQHLGRFTPGAKPGWLFMSTYGGTSWYSNQLMMLEIRPAAERPKVVRLGGFGRYGFSSATLAQDRKTEQYFAENFASLDWSGNKVMVGANWFGRDNLELYQLELPEDWEKQAAAVQIPGTVVPVPTPTPTPTPTPEPTPAPTPTPRPFTLDLHIEGKLSY